jgi:transcriptional regulator with XRE-family HTH domain
MSSIGVIINIVKISILRRFGDRVKSIRKAKGWSQEDLAEKAGLHRTYIGSIERSERNISLLNIERIAKALDVEIEKLTK